MESGSGPIRDNLMQRRRDGPAAGLAGWSVVSGELGGSKSQAGKVREQERCRRSPGQLRTMEVGHRAFRVAEKGVSRSRADLEAFIAPGEPVLGIEEGFMEKEDRPQQT